MNKKADIEISLKTLIGFILVSIIFLAFIGFFMKLWGIFTDKPDEATINSFKNLVYEIKNIEDKEEKIVPYYVQKKFKLTTQNCQRTEQVKEDICVCNIGDCRKKVVVKDYAEPKTELRVIGNDGTSAIRKDLKEGVQNLVVSRNGKVITIKNE